MSIFEPIGDGLWQPSQLAAGPFAGLQGGAVASLLTAELEALAAGRDWGTAVSAAVWFLRPTPMSALRTTVTSIAEGGRVSVIENTLRPAEDERACASVRVTFVREREVSIPPVLPEPTAPPCRPDWLPSRTVRAPHGKRWFMDAMEVRSDGETFWFRLMHPVIHGAGPMAAVLGPADWTHGLSRPLHGVVADPNVNLTVDLFRQPIGEWVGIKPQTRWQPQRGLGMGRGVLLDGAGEIGCVSMAVVLLPIG